MPSKARKAFDESAGDVKRLLEIHQMIAGPKVGRKHRLEVLNKSAIILITAIWEAYCEDLAAEALQHVVKHAHTADVLPKELRKTIAKELTKDNDQLAVWRLAGRGWRKVLMNRLTALTEERNRNLNTPKSQKIVELFDRALGLSDVSVRWSWKGMSSAKAKSKLDKYVTLRGAIAHRGKGSASCTKADVEDYFGHVMRTVSVTGGGVNIHVQKITGKRLW